MNEEPIIETRQLSRVYQDGHSAISVLNAIDFKVMPGESIAIVGHSGSGKSTFLQLLGALDKPTSGELMVEGRSVLTLSEAEKSRMRNRTLGFVYQFHHLLPEFSALENVALPLLIRNESILKAKEEAQKWLTAVGLAERLHHKPGMLSGGEKQRAALARALVTTPRCVLADEPTGNLDRQNAEQIQKLIGLLSESWGISFVVVTHDHQWVRTFHKSYELMDGALRLLL